jgi:hypothetical protein
MERRSDCPGDTAPADVSWQPVVKVRRCTEGPGNYNAPGLGKVRRVRIPGPWVVFTVFRK